VLDNSKQLRRRFSGTNAARDFVEFPSQFNEHWAIYPDVLKHYAKDYRTGQPMLQHRGLAPGED
jgi:Zn-dependent oligopeptidase